MQTKTAVASLRWRKLYENLWKKHEDSLQKADSCDLCCTRFATSVCPCYGHIPTCEEVAVSAKGGNFKS